MSAEHTPASPIRVLLADDHRHVHQAVETLLEQADDIALIGQASNGAEAVRLCGELQPDLVLMDVVMPEMDGVEASTRIRERWPHIKILVLSGFQDDDSVRAMLQSGAIGYVLKGSLAGGLASAIRAAQGGSAVLSTQVTQTLLNGGGRESGQDFGLTEREIEVLRHMTEGLNNGEIAAQLSISRSTVKFHLSNILHKMGVETRAEAIVLAAKNNLI